MNPARILAEKRRIIYPLAFAVLANVLLYAVVVFPLRRQAASAEVEAHTEREALNRARIEHRAAKANVAGKLQADAALQKFYKDVLPASHSAARTLTYARLAQIADESNVRLEQGQSTLDPLKGSSLTKSTTSYTLTGDYRNVRRFIYALETTPEFVVLENVTLTSPGDQAPGRGLAMRLEIATYYRSGYVGE